MSPRLARSFPTGLSLTPGQTGQSIKTTKIGQSVNEDQSWQAVRTGNIGFAVTSDWPTSPDARVDHRKFRTNSSVLVSCDILDILSFRRNFGS